MDLAVQIWGIQERATLLSMNRSLARKVRPDVIVANGTALGFLYPFGTIGGTPFVLQRHFPADFQARLALSRRQHPHRCKRDMGFWAGRGRYRGDKPGRRTGSMLRAHFRLGIAPSGCRAPSSPRGEPASSPWRIALPPAMAWLYSFCCKLSAGLPRFWQQVRKQT